MELVGCEDDETRSHEALASLVVHELAYKKAIDDFVKFFKSKTSMENDLVDEIADKLVCEYKSNKKRRRAEYQHYESPNEDYLECEADYINGDWC